MEEVRTYKCSSPHRHPSNVGSRLRLLLGTSASPPAAIRCQKTGLLADGKRSEHGSTDPFQERSYAMPSRTSQRSTHARGDGGARADPSPEPRLAELGLEVQRF